MFSWNILACLQRSLMVPCSNLPQFLQCNWIRLSPRNIPGLKGQVKCLLQLFFSPVYLGSLWSQTGELTAAACVVPSASLDSVLAEKNESSLTKLQMGWISREEEGDKKMKLRWMRKEHTKGDTKADVDVLTGRAAAGKSNFGTGE